MKEYNQYELRFLQVLVSRKRYQQIIGQLYYQLIDKYLWHGTKILKQEQDKVTESIKEILGTPDIEIKWSAADDYLKTITDYTKVIKEDIAKGCGLTVKELFGGKEDELQKAK